MFEQELRDSISEAFREYETDKLSDFCLIVQMIYNMGIKNEEGITIKLPISIRRNSREKANFPRILTLIWCSFESYA